MSRKSQVQHSSASCGSQGSVISQEMIEEERKLEKEAEEAERHIHTEKKYEPQADERRFECFKKLMNHSEAYTNYISHKMHTQVNLRRFERARKFYLMRSFREKYVKEGIDCDEYLVDTMENQDVVEKDPQCVLEGNMLNVNGQVVPLHQPFVLVNVTLRPYQVDGVHWLKVLYENGVNGILADEMGLGKTVQCISTIAHLLEMGIKGPFLVVAPLSTLPNWMAEFRQFAPLVPVILYHGSMEQRLEIRRNVNPVKFLDSKTEPVILTSYEIVIRDHAYLGKFTWSYLVIDEAHRIKNFNCLLIRRLRQLNAVNRLLLTGTPLQNNLSELWSLMNFIIPEVFGDLESFEMWLNPEEILDSENCGKIVAQEQKQQVLQTMHRILRPFILRRVKSEVEIDIPLKKEILVYAPLTKLQEKYYKGTLEKTIRSMFTIEEEPEILGPRKRSRSDENSNPQKDDIRSKRFRTQAEGSGKMTRSSLKSQPVPNNKATSVDSFFGDTNIKTRNPTMQLRKIVNHPYLIHYPLDPRTEQYMIDEDLINNCGKLLVVDAILRKLKEDGHRVLIFSQMKMLMDILEDYLSLRDYTYLRLDGTVDLAERQRAIEKFNEKETFIFLISTRAGGLGINLTAADTVIIYDSDWNPQCDLQAMDRCHRIGQTKPVVVYRLVTAATIDEQIVKRATAKRKLEKMVIQTGRFKEKKGQVNGMSIQELKDLLASSDYDVKIQPNGLVFSDEELNSLLDRKLLFQETKGSGKPNEEGGASSSKDNTICDKNNQCLRDHQKLYTVL